MKNPKLKAVSIFLLLFIFIAGCQHKDKEQFTSQPNVPGEDREMKNLEEAPPPPQTMQKTTTGAKETDKSTGNITTQNAQNIDVTKRMIIRTGTMGVEIEKFDDAAKTVSEIVKRDGGYISNTTSSQNSSGKKQGTLVLKVPADKYDALISEVSAVGKVMSQNINANDITEEFIDLEARQKTQKELEQRLLKLLSEKTARLTDVVEVEQKLASVRQIIESIDGRLRYLKNQSEMSTLTLSLYEPALLQTSSGGGFFYELGQGVKSGLRGFTDILKGMITLFIALLPLIIFVLIIIWIIRRILKKRKLKSS
jgi:hypothetical protein